MRADRFVKFDSSSYTRDRALFTARRNYVRSFVALIATQNAVRPVDYVESEMTKPCRC